jgi:hypothetical protein
LSDNYSSVLKSQQQPNGSRAAGHSAQLIASAVAAALQDPEFIVRIAAGRRHGGVRAKIANWPDRRAITECLQRNKELLNPECKAAFDAKSR